MFPSASLHHQPWAQPVPTAGIQQYVEKEKSEEGKKEEGNKQQIRKGKALGQEANGLVEAKRDNLQPYIKRAVRKQ